MSNVSGENAGPGTRGKGQGGQGKYAALGKNKRASDDDDDDDDDGDDVGAGDGGAWVPSKPAVGQRTVPKPAPQQRLSKKLQSMPLLSSQGPQSTLTVNIRNLQEKQDGSGLGVSQRIKHTFELSVPSRLAERPPRRRPRRLASCCECEHCRGRGWSGRLERGSSAGGSCTATRS